MIPNVYKMAISNTARAIRKQTAIAEPDTEPGLNAFTASEVLAFAFCKSKEEVLADLILADTE